MPKFSVPVIYEICGDIHVEADGPEEAIQKAKETYDKKRIAAIKGPTYSVEFALDENSEEVSSLSDEDWEEWGGES
jgi:hypothetical protein